MEKAPKLERFLEPVYLNETMALNCAAYLFKGFPAEATSTESNEKRREAAVKAGLPFLLDFIGLSGAASQTTREERTAARKFTIGGLHMNVIDALYEKGMISTLSNDLTDAKLDQAGLGDKYVHVNAILRASDYYALLDLLSTLGPLLSQLVAEFGEPLAHKLGIQVADWHRLGPEIEKYSESIMLVIEKLGDDYLTSRQLEMVMWTSPTSRIGVVDLDVSEYDPKELKAKLTGGRYQIFGKVVARAKQNQKLSLLQRTMLFEGADLFTKIKAFSESIETKRRENDAEQLDDSSTFVSANTQTEELRKQLRELSKIVNLEIPGPAIRISALSVCI